MVAASSVETEEKSYDCSFIWIKRAEKDQLNFTFLLWTSGR